MLAVRQLTYRLPDHRLLFEQVDLTVNAGSICFVVGPSGSGKTTFLSLIGGLLLPSAGSIDINFPSQRPIAWILQSTNFLGARTAVDNAMLFAAMDGAPPQQARRSAERMLSLLGLQQQGSQKARELSGGESQRVAIARALASERPLILADEPTSQLDRRASTIVMASLVAAANNGKAVLVVTHDVESIPSGSQILNLGGGGERQASCR